MMDPITIRDVIYPNRGEAAKALGVSVRTIHSAACKGRLATVGLGHHPKAPEYLPVSIRGTLYPSVQAAAMALKIHPSTISCALARGTIDTVGLGRGHRARGNSRGGAPAKPGAIGPLTFPSRRAASSALGFAPTYVGKVLNRPSYEKFQRLLAAALDFSARRDRGLNHPAGRNAA